MRDPNHNYKTIPDPPTRPGSVDDPVQQRIALESLRTANAEMGEKYKILQKRFAEAQELLGYYVGIESRLDPFTNEGPLRRRRPLKESLELIAEIFVTKYPQEDAEVVRNLVEMFTGPVEQALAGGKEPDVSAGTPR